MIIYACFINDTLIAFMDVTEKCKGHDANYWQDKETKNFVNQFQHLPEEIGAKHIYFDVPPNMEILMSALLKLYESKLEHSLNKIHHKLEIINFEVSNLYAEFSNLVNYYQPIEENEK